jgi:hypothetical protein
MMGEYLTFSSTLELSLMPIVFENPNTEEAIARVVFDKELLTLFYRRFVCGAGAMEGEEFLAVIRAQEPELATYNPVIIDHTGPRHRHLRMIDTTLSHVHLSFDQSIEEGAPRKLLIKVIDGLQTNFREAWEKYKIAADLKFGQSTCATILFSEVLRLEDKTSNYLKPKTSFFINPATCLWARSNAPIQKITCNDLPFNIPSYLDMVMLMNTIMDLHSPRISENTDTKVTVANENFEPQENSLQALLLTYTIGLMLATLLLSPCTRRVRRLFQNQIPDREPVVQYYQRP